MFHRADPSSTLRVHSRSAISPSVSSALVAALAAIGLAPCAAAQAELVENQRIAAPHHPGNPGNDPGLSGLDVDGNTFVVGANLMAWSQGSTVVPAVGAALVYTRSGSGAAWSLEAELRPNDPAASQFFGSNVALSGDRAAIGSIGAVYAFERSQGVWRQTGRFARSPVARAASLDGDLLAIGDWSVAVAGRVNAGRVSLHRYRAGAWIHEADLSDPSPDAEDSFGRHVSVSGDRVLVYSANHSAGISSPVAHVFVRTSTGTWQHEAALQPDWGTGSLAHVFRLSSASLSGNSVLMQGGSLAAILERTQHGWVQTQVIDKRAWGFLANDYHQDLRDDVFVVSSGRRVHDGLGFVSLVFRRVGGTWIKQAVLTQTAGYGLALPQIDGDTVVTARGDVHMPCAVGSPPTCGRGTIHTYDLDAVPEAYGVGCSGARIPLLSVGAIPDLGAAADTTAARHIDFAVANAAPASFGFLVVGVGRVAVPIGGECAVQLNPIPNAIGPLLLSGSANSPAGSGQLALRLALPPRLLGAFSVQALVIDSASANGVLTVSAPLEIVVP
ncbi:MAG: FG-GAP repeat protein [Planctomycetota bacterium]